jgi:predicted N-acetyltransferase YhbS
METNPTMDSPAHLHVMAPDIPAHGDAVAQLIAETFHEDPSPETIARIRSMADLPDWMQLGDCRIGRLGDRVVTSVTVYRYQTRIGSARLVTSGIGAVACHKDYRRRGLMRETFSATIEPMREAGYDISVLFGIPDFYWQFGYVRGWSDDNFALQASDLAPTVPAPDTERFDGAPLSDEIVASMNRWQEELHGTAVRPTHGGANKHQGDHIRSLAWRTPEGAVDGTLIAKLEEEQLKVEDACGDPETIIALVAQLCAEHGKERVFFSQLHCRSPLARRLRLGTCQMNRHYRRNAGPLVRIVNLRSCLEKLAADLSGRLRMSCHADWHGVLLVEDGREAVGLRISAGSVRVVDPVPSPHQLLAGDHMACLVFGAEDPADTLARPQVECLGDAAELTTALFPELSPQLPSMDRY